MAKKVGIWQRRRADELAGRKAAYYKTPEQLAEEAEVDEDNPDDKDIYDTGDNVRSGSAAPPTLSRMLYDTFVALFLASRYRVIQTVCRL